MFFRAFHLPAESTRGSMRGCCDRRAGARIRLPGCSQLFRVYLYNIYGGGGEFQGARIYGFCFILGSDKLISKQENPNKKVDINRNCIKKAITNVSSPGPLLSQICNTTQLHGNVITCAGFTTMQLLVSLSTIDQF
jgi:hypothetical protein